MGLSCFDRRERRIGAPKSFGFYRESSHDLVRSRSCRQGNRSGAQMPRSFAMVYALALTYCCSYILLLCFLMTLSGTEHATLSGTHRVTLSGTDRACDLIKDRPHDPLRDRQSMRPYQAQTTHSQELLA